MLWLFVIAMVGGLLFVMFHKPQVHNVVGWTPRSAPTKPLGTEPGDNQLVTEFDRSAASTVLSLTDMRAAAASSMSDLSAMSSDDEDNNPTSTFVPLDFNEMFKPSQPVDRSDRPNG